MYYRLRAAWWKLHPPPILSPLLHRPRYAQQVSAAFAPFLTSSQHPVEIGCLFGWTTNIILNHLHPGVILRTFDIANRLTITSNRLTFNHLNIWHWLDGPFDLGEFDFLYIDVNNTELTFREVWRKCRYEIATGVPVLFEGATRLRINIPHKVLIKDDPGLGLLLP